MIIGLVFSCVGLGVLALAAEQFVKGGARLAVVLRLSPMVVGAVVIGFGTSAPEMVVSGLAAAEGRLDIGVGNIVGSNAANVSLVLGAAALLATMGVRREIVRRDGPLSVLAVVLFALLVQGQLHRWEGVLLVVLLVLWLASALRNGRRELTQGQAASVGPAGGEELIEDYLGDRQPRAAVEVLRTLAGLAFVIGSAYLLVNGAERVADSLGLSGGFVGYTLVAVGTSAPELVTAIAAARQRQTELLVGNLLGSNVFNSLAVGGVIALVGPGPVGDSRMQTLGSALMVLICVVSLLLMTRRNRVSRIDGAILLTLWALSVVLLAG